MTTYHAIRVDQECNGEEFWEDLRENLPDVAKSLEANDCAIVSHEMLMRLDGLGAFTTDPSPLIDYGTDGPAFADVAASRHAVFN